MAPEGSPERIAARVILLRSLAAALDDGMSVVEWEDHAVITLHANIAAAGPRDLKTIVDFTLRARQRK